MKDKDNAEHKKGYVLHLASWYPNPHQPFNAPFIKDQVEALTNIKGGVLLSVSRVDGLDEKSTTSGHKQNLTEHIACIPNTMGSRLVYFIILFRLVRSVFKEKGRPEFIHVHVMYPAVAVAYVLNLLYKIPYLITEHFTVFTPESKHPSKRFITLFTTFFSKRASLITAVGPSLKKSLIGARFKPEIRVVPNPVNPRVFYPGQPRTGESVRFIHISSLKEEHKNVRAIIRVFARLRELHPDVSLTVVGSEPKNLKFLKDFCAKSLPGTVVNFLPGMDKYKLAETMRDHDVLVLFSRYETFSLVTAEALSCGLFVVSSDVDGPNELIRPNETGFLVPSLDEEALFSALTACVLRKKSGLLPNFSASAEIRLEERFMNDFKEIYNHLVV